MHLFEGKKEKRKGGGKVYDGVNGRVEVLDYEWRVRRMQG
jgi:hypothetical protein